MTDIRESSLEKHDPQEVKSIEQKWKKIYDFNSLTIEIQIPEDQSENDDTGDIQDISLDEGSSPGSSSDESPSERGKRLRVSKET